MLDALNLLEKWDVADDPPFREDLRAEMQERCRKPTSDASGVISGDESGAVRQRRTICDAAIIVYENTSECFTPVRSVHPHLVRASILAPGFVEMKPLYP